MKSPGQLLLELGHKLEIAIITFNALDRPWKISGVVQKYLGGSFTYPN